MDKNSKTLYVKHSSLIKHLCSCAFFRLASFKCFFVFFLTQQIKTITEEWRNRAVMEVDADKRNPTLIILIRGGREAEEGECVGGCVGMSWILISFPGICLSLSMSLSIPLGLPLISLSLSLCLFLFLSLSQWHLPIHVGYTPYDSFISTSTIS